MKFRCVRVCTIVASSVIVCLLLAPAVGLARDSVCEEVRNNTPGLYGLCIAFCEAHGCTVTEVEDGTCKPSSSKILANYNKKKEEWEPDMPCYRSPCPCFDREDLELIVGTVGFPCTRRTWDEGDDIKVRSAPICDPGDDFATYNLAFASEFVQLEEPGSTCFYTRIEQVGDECVRVGDFPTAPDDITGEEAQACYDILEQFCIDYED